MTLSQTSEESIKENCDLQIKLHSGVNITKVKPLFTRDSKNILVASGQDVKSFNIVSGECVVTLTHHTSSIVSLRLNPNNALQIFSCSEDGTVVRWDYTEGTALQVYKLEGTFRAFYVPYPNDMWFALIESTDHFRLFSLKHKFDGSFPRKLLIKHVLPKENAVAFDVNGKFVATVHAEFLYIYNYENQKMIRHKTGTRKLVCVCSHPSETCVATGDNTGRVVVWRDMLYSNHPIQSIYHWHSLPVADLLFSREGSYIISGGGEATLVKWRLNVERPDTIPRLGLPICNLSITQDNSYFAITFEDNALHILNAQNNLIQVIQSLTRSTVHGTRHNDILTGMLYDSHTESLVMNGKPGHLQFYKIAEDRQLFNLDIVGRNIISQERDSVIVNTDIYRAAIDDKGLWLSTVEYRDDGVTNPEIQLKFWEFNLEKQMFVLNTNVILPHNQKINCIKFKPSAQNEHLCVTTSDDKRFKFWALNGESGSNQSWSCEFMGYYRDLPPGDASFSEDGSLVAVASGDVVTLWTLEDRDIKAELCDDAGSDVVQVLFGVQDCCHFLVSHNSTIITVWNVLALSVHWKLHVNVQYLSASPYSPVFAAFCENQDLIIFKPSHPNPIYTKENVSKIPVISAIFVPNDSSKESSNSNCWHKKAQLFFMDQNQNLLKVADASDQQPEANKIILQQNLPKTPFGILQAEHKAKGSRSTDDDDIVLHNHQPLKDKVLEMPLHFTQNPMALCSEVLHKLLLPSQNNDFRDSEESPSIPESSTKNHDSESDSETEVHPMKIEKDIQIDNELECDTRTNFIGITDYSFLRTKLKF